MYNLLYSGLGYYSESYGVKASADDTAQEDGCRNGVSSQEESVLVKTEPHLYWSDLFSQKYIIHNCNKFNIPICICYTCTQVFTVILKGLPGRF